MKPERDLATYADVRNKVVGYNDAALTATKIRLAEELDVNEGDLDAVLADEFNLERCSSCGHWFDKGDCDRDDGKGGYECAACAVD